MPDRKTQRYKCVCAYDGTMFSGWQSQPNGLGVQDFIERRLAEILGQKTRIHGSGRTDAGVHANNQVFHFDAECKHGSRTLFAALRCGYPDDILIKSVLKVPQNFHARFSASGKRYVYKLMLGYAPPELTRYRWSLGNRVPDVGKMLEAAKLLLGRHDFTALSANRGKPDEDTFKTLTRLDVKKRGRNISITVEGDGFLYKMVRLIVGALVSVGLGKLSTCDLLEALESRKRGTLFQAAPAKGLFLDKVFYSKNSKTMPHRD